MRTAAEKYQLACRQGKPRPATSSGNSTAEEFYQSAYQSCTATTYQSSHGARATNKAVHTKLFSDADQVSSQDATVSTEEDTIPLRVGRGAEAGKLLAQAVNSLPHHLR